MKTIQNPILRGFCPDPCMIRTGDDYYIATSTFEWWPCVNLYHSKDLAHWEQLPSPLREPGQMDLRGDPNSGGIWAPDLSWDGQYYYLLVTNVTTKKGRWYNTHNYMSRAASITGPWSQPVYLNSIGFDPSLLHDTDGKCYLVNMVNGFKGVLVQQMDPETGALLGDCVNLTVRPGWLRLTGQESMNSLHHVTLVARRQQEHEMQAETRMDFAPVCPEQMAGFTYCYDSMNFYLLGKTCAEDGTPVLELLKSDTGVVEDVCDPVPVPDGTLDFKLTTTPDGGMAQFYYRQPQGEWQSIGPACPTDILTDEHCRGFTGAHVGVYAHDMAGLHNHADFDYLNVHFER